jgi:hypothetical protein
MNIDSSRSYDHLTMTDRIPIQAFLFDGFNRARAFSAAGRSGSPLVGLLVLLTLIVLVPLILIGLLLGGIAITALLAARTAWMRFRSLLPRDDGRENVRIVTRR